MKGFFKLLFSVILLGIIIGGLGYIGWTTLHGGHAGHNINQVVPQSPQRIPNKMAVQNKIQLTEALDNLNRAMDLITMDPYSKITVPSGNIQMFSKGTINIFPRDNSTVNIDPSGNVANQEMLMSQGQDITNLNFVADQSKLQQVHNGIYRISQGMLLMNELRDDLTNQASLTEPNPPTIDTYVLRYNLALQNRIKLTTALQMLNEAVTLINVNPYASSNGYVYNADKMENLHKGIYQLAQAITKLNRLNNSFTTQMLEAQQQASQAMSGTGNMLHGSTGHGNMPISSWFPSLALIINITLIILLAGLLIGIFGTLISLLNGKKESREDKIDAKSGLREETSKRGGEIK